MGLADGSAWEKEFGVWSNKQSKVEKLTTGQMIDRLGLMDVAINQDGYKVGYDHKGNLLMWGKHEEKPQIKEGNEFLVYFPLAKNDVWIIKRENEVE